MRIGGNAQYYADILTKEDVEEAVTFARGKNIPLIVLGGGSNTIFADDVIDALVIRIKTSSVLVDGNHIEVESGKILASLINELAKHNLDLSALTGIPGTIGGAIFGNAGQGIDGIWIDSFVESVEAFVDGAWRTYTKEECDFRYRESKFKEIQDSGYKLQACPIIWKSVLHVPSRPEAEIKEEVERLLKKRIETQPHMKTAGSCFKALPDGTPAWKLIDAAGLRGMKIGDVQVAEKHANFLLNVGTAKFEDAVAITKKIREAVPEIAGIEMRFYGEDGRIVA